MSEWKKIGLGKLAEIQTGPFGSQLHQEDYVPVGTPLITVKNLGENKVTYNKLDFVSDQDKERLSKFILQEGDIVFSRVGYVDRRAFITKKESGWLFSGSTLRVRVKETSPLNPKYISYYFGQKKFKEYIKNMSVGATRPSLNTQLLEELEIITPSLPEQLAIASVLSSLDDKIDLLHRQNKTLEAMAETLFRQWFVEEADEGWEEGTLGDYINVKHGYAFKGKHITTEKNNQILVTPGNFKIGGGFKFGKMKYFIELDYPKDYIFSSDDLIVTMTDLSKEGDTLGYSALIPEHNQDEVVYLHNQRVGRVEFKKDISKYFVYYLMKTDDYQWFILGGASGTSVRHTSPTSICSYPFQVPPMQRIKEFDAIVSGLISKVHKNQKQIQTLEKLRDTLLPKVMSGEVRVSY